MTIPTVPNYTGEIALRSAPANFPQNAEDQYSYLANLSVGLNGTVEAMNTAVTDVNDNTAIASQVKIDAEASANSAEASAISAAESAAEVEDVLLNSISSLQAAALAAGTTYDNITYSTNLVDEIKGYIFDTTKQVTYAVPESAQGKFIQSVVGGLLTTTDASEYNLGVFIQEQESNLKKYGGVADYEGEPEYDGLDSTRVTATDNTTAFRDCVLNALDKNIPVYIPKGHFGIKEGNLEIDLQGKVLTFFGDGVDSILDFIKEDSTHTSTVVISTCNAICKFSNGYLKFKDMRVKGTTNLLNVSGNQNPDDQPDVYFGSVWGFTLKGFGIECENVETDHFNFRGMTCEPSAPLLLADIKMNNCKGHHCVSTAYWWKYCDVNITGGEFYRNGRPGTKHTGYGVLNEEGCGTVSVSGATFKENCRKGLDSRALVTNVIACNFIDNRLKDFDLQQVVAGSELNKCTLIGNTIEYNVNKDFINLCDSQHVALGGTGKLNKTFISATESESNLDLFGNFTMTHNTIKAYSGGQLIPTAFSLLHLAADKNDIKHNSIDITGLNVDNDLGVREISPFYLEKNNAVVDWEFNSVKLPSLAQTSGLYNGSVFIMPPSGLLSALNIHRSTFEISDAVMFASDIGDQIGGVLDDFNLSADDNTVTIRSMKLGLSPVATKTNALDWVNIEKFFFGTNHANLKNRLILDKDNSYNITSGLSGYGDAAAKSVRKSGSTVGGNVICNILIPKTGGDIDIVVKGVNSLYANELITTYAANTYAKTDRKTGVNISMGALSEVDVLGSTVKMLSIPILSIDGVNNAAMLVTVSSVGFIGSDIIAGVNYP